MKSLSLFSSSILPWSYCRSPPFSRLQFHYQSSPPGLQRSSFFFKPILTSHQTSRSVSPEIPNEGVEPAIYLEDFEEKDWSFLEAGETNTSEEHKQKIDRVISGGEIRETSRVLVSIGSEDFVDRLVNASSCDLLLLVHDSLFTLACIKEKHDRVKCWQGELLCVPERWAPFDVVFLYYLPALPFQLGQILEALARLCLPGARVVISHLHGREILEQQREKYPDVVVSVLPEKKTLQMAAADRSFEVGEFVDDASFYLAVLRFHK